MRLDLREQGDQVGTVKLPLKGSWPFVGPCFVQGQAEPNRLQGGNVMWCQHLPLDDRELACHPMEPTGVDRGMAQHDARIDLVQPPLGGFAPMRRAVVHTPAQACAGTRRFLRQHLVHQAAQRRDAGRRFTPTHDVPTAHVPRRQLLPGATAFKRVLDAGRSARRRGEDGVATAAGVHTRLLIGTEAIVLGAKGLALPGARLPVQNGSRLSCEAGNTPCQPHALLACEYFRGSAPGPSTLPTPFATSCWCCWRPCAICAASGSFTLAGRIVRRSLWPFPARTRIWWLAKSIAARGVAAASRRRPAPDKRLAMLQWMPSRALSSALPSGRVHTTGRRGGRLARTTASNQPRCWPRTWRSRKPSAQSA